MALSARSASQTHLGSLPRQVKISYKFVAMLEALPKQGEKIWGIKKQL